MTDDTKRSEGSLSSGGGAEIDVPPAEEVFKDDPTVSDSKKCPECGEPIHDLRTSCPRCNYEYQDSDYDTPEAGKEFNAGSELDDSELGSMLTDDTSGEERTAGNPDKGSD